MRSSSIDLTSEERCPVCDFIFSRSLPTPVREHGAHHRRYLAACEGTGAPVDSVKREGECVSVLAESEVPRLLSSAESGAPDHISRLS